MQANVFTETFITRLKIYYLTLRKMLLQVNSMRRWKRHFTKFFTKKWWTQLRSKKFKKGEGLNFKIHQATFDLRLYNHAQLFVTGMFQRFAFLLHIPFSVPFYFHALF